MALSSVISRAPALGGYRYSMLHRLRTVVRQSVVPEVLETMGEQASEPACAVYSVGVQVDELDAARVW